MRSILWLLVCALVRTVWISTAFAQAPDSLAAPMEMTSEEDHRLMMQMLGIDSLRPGPSGNPDAPNAANSDEAKVPPYELPDVLTTEGGKRITTAGEWWDVRRPEIVELFDREVYGRVPEDVPAVRWEVVSITPEMNGPYRVKVKKLVGRVDNSDYPAIEVNIDLTVVTPANAVGPVPLMMEFGFSFPPGMRRRFAPRAPTGPSWQQQLLEVGWGYAILVPTSFQADNGAGLTKGIIGLVNRGQPRKPDDWGSLRAWAWGASRALDYLETDPDVDASQVGIEGLSRYGKAAIVAMAYEPRLAVGFIGSSGAGGAKILRRVFGEQVENLASSGEYHWFAGNFIKYAGPLTPNDLPVDAHQLVALAAPRPVYISVGSPFVEGQWVDGHGMFLAGVHASPVYELLGKRGLRTDEMPPIETGLLEGELVFRQHAGGHTTGPNWPTFIEFANRYVDAAPIEDEWVGTWGTSVQLTEPRNMPPEPGLDGNTLRQVVRVSIGGERLRVRFSNAFGDSAITIQSAHLAVSKGEGAIDPGTDVPLTFLGQPGVTIQPGSSVSADPIDFSFEARNDLAITTWFGEVPHALTGHPGSRTTSYIVPGDAVTAAEMPDAVRTDHWYVITGIDTENDDAAAVVTLGNSITDGRGSGTNLQNRWPDELARRLHANSGTENVAVLNAGIGGNCVLRDCLGPAAVARFQRDVLDQNGVRWLIVLEGVNDIGGSQPDSSAVVADRLIEAYGNMVEWAHARDVKV
ncbi:MAG TPA: GDSL-type esterase/lipase family protein, partial [Rhodothermales bacterium]